MYTDKKIDMHIHTHYSDGTDSPIEIIRWAQNKGLDEIAITDHDNINGIKETIDEGKRQGILVHAGIEFTTAYKEELDLHILGYDFDIESVELEEVCGKISMLRDKRNDKMLKLLERQYGLTYDELGESIERGFVGKPILARALLRKGCVKNIDQVYEEIFSKREFLNIKKEKIGVKEAIDVINCAGGIAVLAHPGLIKGIGERESLSFFEKIKIILDDLCDNGLRGIECIYSKHSKEEEKVFLKLANKKKLIATRGSDYHGDVEK